MHEVIDKQEPTIPSLCDVLKHSSRDHHRHAERTGVIRQMVKRQISRAQYAVYLRNLYPVYRALEHRLATLCLSPGFELITDPALARSQSIEQDMSNLIGIDWQDRFELMESAEIYADRIAAASLSQLVAHAYVRYLGDLNGGQIVKRLLREALELTDRELSFYDFPDIDNIPDFRLRFRASLNALSGNLDIESVISETLSAFQMATALSISAVDSESSEPQLELVNARA
jgi:heme oxygenase